MAIQCNDSKEISQIFSWWNTLRLDENSVCRLQVQFKASSSRSDSFTRLSVCLMPRSTCRVGYFKPLQSRGCKLVEQWPGQNQDMAWVHGLTLRGLPSAMRDTLLNTELSNSFKGVIPFRDSKSSMETGRWYALEGKKEKRSRWIMGEQSPTRE